MTDASDRRAVTRERDPRSMPATRIEELRARIDTGSYANETLLQATARAILEREDL